MSSLLSCVHENNKSGTTFYSLAHLHLSQVSPSGGPRTTVVTKGFTSVATTAPKKLLISSKSFTRGKTQMPLKIRGSLAGPSNEILTNREGKLNEYSK